MAIGKAQSSTNERIADGLAGIRKQVEALSVAHPVYAVVNFGDKDFSVAVSHTKDVMFRVDARKDELVKKIVDWFSKGKPVT